MIEFRSLTEEEQRNPRHFCGRCEPTERWKRARAAMRARGQEPLVHLDEPPLRESVHSVKLVHLSTVHSTVEQEHQEVDTSGVDKVDSNLVEVDVSNSGKSREDMRREYEREYKCRKRAEARKITGVE